MNKTNNVLLLIVICALTLLSINRIEANDNWDEQHFYVDSREEALAAVEGFNPFEGIDCEIHPCRWSECYTFNVPWPFLKQYTNRWWMTGDVLHMECYFYPYEENDDKDCCKEDEIQPGGQCCKGKKCPESTRGNPVDIYSGENKETETDLQFDSPFKKGFKVYRFYSSKSSNDSSIGVGWTHNYNVILEPFGEYEPLAYKITDEFGRYHYYQDRNGDGIYSGFLSTTGHLTTEPDGSFVWYRGNGIKYTFNQFLKFAAKEDGNGNVQTLTYDQDDRLSTVTDQATGRTVLFHYNNDSRIDFISGPVTTAVISGIWVNYEYDSSGNLKRVVYSDQNNGSAASGFEYLYEDPNDDHNLTQKRNLAGQFLSQWDYDASDRAWKNTTREGKGVQFTRNGSTVTVYDVQGVWKRYYYSNIDGAIKLTGVEGGGGCASCGGDAVRYGYDDQRRVNEIEYANGRIDQYADFDATDRYHTAIQAAGTVDERTFHYTYHPETGDRLSIIETSILGAGSKETIFDYDDDGNAVPNENPTRLMRRKIERGFTYDAAGAVAPYEYITTYTYTARGQVESVDGPLPGTQDLVSYTYDAVTGDKLTETRPLVGTTTYGYDAAGNVTSVSAPDGSLTTITYDGRNRQLSTTRNGVTQSRTYTAAGELATTTDALERTMDYTYNGAGFMEKIVDPSGNFIYYGYNAIGQRVEESIFAADNTQAHFRGTDYGDPVTNPDLVSGKPWKSIHRNADDTADLETTYAYDASGNLTSVTDANGNVTTYVYDLFNRLSQVIQPEDAVTTYAYDGQGNLASVTDAEGHVTTYAYDDLGRLVETDSPDTGTTLYSYDAAGNLRFKVQNGNSIEYRYDSLGRLTDILYADAGQNVTMTYDSGAGANLIGRLASVADPAGLTEYSYDADGHLEMETRTVNGIVYVTSYGYDAAGNLRSITYPTGQTIEYQPDGADPARIGAVVLNPYGSNQTLASAMAYKPFGPAAAMTLGSGGTITRTFDKNYQLLSLAAGAALDRTYTPDNVGNILAITDNLDAARSQSFAYDDLYRLTNASGIYGAIAYTYDKTGNRLTRTRTGAAPIQDAYAYYAGTNRLQTIVGDHAELFLYDADGNTTQRIPGAANVQPPITDPADYIYNSAGQRARKINSSPVVYHYDLSGQLIAETDAAGNMLKAYVWLHGQPLAMITADGLVYYFINDHLGTPQKMIDSSGAVVWAADYLPFGKADVTIATVENNLRFAGQYYDSETGLHYNYFRYYDPKLGRYLRTDPIGIKKGKNQPYTYVQNNPLRLVDLYGLVPSWWPSLYGGFEYNIGPWGKGGSWVSCCDDNNVRWEFAFEKVCWGFAVGFSISGGHVTEMSGKKCDFQRYEGQFLEFKIPYVGVDLGKDGVNDLGLSFGPNAGLMVCTYKKVDKRKLGCCN